MKPGFGKKAAKAHKKKKKAGKKAADEDAAMADARQQPRQPSPVDTAGQGAQLTAKEKQRRRMELKQALKVQVAGLKQKRSKLTKLAGGERARKDNKALRSLLTEQLAASSKQASPAAAVFASGGEAMQAD